MPAALRPAPSALARTLALALSGCTLLSFSPAATAQEAEPAADIPSPATIDSISHVERSAPITRSRVYLGPGIGPAYAGADRMSWGPFIEVSRARDGEYFAFEAPDESFGFNLYEKKGTAFGFAVNMVGKRKAKDTDYTLSTVGSSFELGVTGQSWLSDNIRLRAEARKAVSGHKAFVGSVSADYVVQRGDEWVFSVGPRVTLADSKFHRRYYGVNGAEALRSGLPVTRPKGGVHSAGAAASILHQFNDKWGVAAFAAYERLVGDAASSPVTRTYGSRNQPSAGVAISYTFGTAP
jgi:outer membrane protein